MLLYSRTPGDVDKVAIKLNTMLENLNYMLQNEYLQNVFGTLFALVIFVFIVRSMWQSDEQNKKASFDESLQDNYQRGMSSTWCPLTRMIYARLANELENGAMLSPQMDKLYRELVFDKMKDSKRPIERLQKSQAVIDAEIQQGETLTLQ